MLARIAAFELRYQLRSPLFFVAFALFFLLAFGSATVDQVRIGGRGNVNVNSPFALLQTTAIMSVFAIFVVTAFVANVVIRDDETGFAPILRATRIRKLDYLLGRFVGAMLVALIVMAAVPLGILVGSWMPWVDPERIGPFVASHYVYALAVVALPSLLVSGAGLFALATATRSMMWTYVGAVGTIVLFFVSRVLLRDPAYDTISALSDPFGIGALVLATKYWTASDRNTLLPAVTGMLLWNRLLWGGVAVALFGLAYAIFRFEARGARMSAPGRPKREYRSAQHEGSPVSPQDRSKGESRSAQREGSPVSKASADATRTLSAVAPAFHRLADPDASALTRRRQFLALTRFDLRYVFRSPAFFVLLAIGVLNSFGTMNAVIEVRGTEYFPVTRALVMGLQGAFSIFPVIIAIYYAGEMVWHDRERRIHEIVDATAAPDWAFMVPKVMAIALVLITSYVVAMLTGMAFQLAHGYTRVQPLAYLLWFVVPGAINAILLAALAVFVQALVPNKFVGWAVMVVYIVGTITLSNVGFEHNLYQYAGEPSVPLSDMNGMGRFWIGRAWFQAYWLAFALMLAVLAHLLWRRGVDTRLRPRLARVRHRLHGAPLALLGSAAVAWLALGAWNYWNTNVRNEYQTERGLEDLLADYEKTLLAYEKIEPPHIVDVKLAVDLEPAATRATTRGSYVIQNRTQAPMPVVHVRWAPPLRMESLDIDGARLEKEYADFRYRIYAFDTPMQPGEKRTLRFTSVLEERGFPNARPLTRIVENGTFVSNLEVAPVLGMGRDMLLQDRAKRRKHGLPPELRPPKLEDEAADAHHYLRHDSDFVTAEITLTTDADQTPVAPGTRVSDTVTGNRRTLVTRTEAPIHNFFSLQSARYATKTDTWTGKDGRAVQLAVYYHPPHEHNVQRMLDAMKHALQFCGERFSPYQFNEARVLEFPAYATFAQAFAGTVPYSEAIGFVQNHRAEKDDESIDLVTYVTAHEIAHQWWAHQVIGADKQGMTMLSESFAQYSALRVMEKLYGREQIRKFLKYELDAYLRSRGGEVVEELPLDRVENQPYIHYRKGSLVMYWLKEAVGEDVVDRALRELIAAHAFKAAPYPSTTDFLRILRAQAGPQHDQLITDLFERITLYDVKASDANARRLPDGRYEVTFNVDAKKLYADGKGKETEAPLDEAFEVGAFTAEPGRKGYRSDSVLAVERRPIRSGRQAVTLVVDRAPSVIGVDPFNKRIDRNSEDNIAKVTLQ